MEPAAAGGAISPARPQAKNMLTTSKRPIIRGFIMINDYFECLGFRYYGVGRGLTDRGIPDS